MGGDAGTLSSPHRAPRPRAPQPAVAEFTGDYLAPPSGVRTVVRPRQ
jgi:hypothetical protein